MSDFASAIQLPEYVCHKRVRAAKILAIEDRADGTGLVLYRIEHPEHPQAVSFQSFEWHLRHAPEVGGYIVQYGDGYHSYSPAKAFEEGYQLLTAQPASSEAT